MFRKHVSALVMLALTSALPSQSTAQTRSKIFDTAADFCLSFALGQDPDISSLQKAGFALTKKRNGNYAGRGQTKDDDIKIFTDQRGKRLHCLIETGSRSYGGSSQGTTVVALLSWVKSRKLDIALFQKGLLQVATGGHKVSISLVGRHIRGGETASIGFSKDS